MVNVYKMKLTYCPEVASLRTITVVTIIIYHSKILSLVNEL